MARFLTLAAAVEETIRDGDAVAMEGFTHLIPFAAAHEVIRQRRKRLTIKMTPDLIYDQLIGMGCAEADLLGSAIPASARCTARATPSRTAGPIRSRSRSTPTPPCRRLRPAPRDAVRGLRGYIGVDLPKVNPNIRHVTCPFTGDVLRGRAGAAPRRGDHPRAQGRPRRQCAIEGILGVQKEAVLASKRRSLRWRRSSTISARSFMILPHWTVGAIAHAGGPTVLRGLLHATMPLHRLGQIARERESFRVMKRTLEAGPRYLPITPPRRRRWPSPCQRVQAQRNDDDRGARALRNTDVFVGIGMPSAAIWRGSRTPDITLIYESGTIGTKPDVLPLDRRRRIVRDRAHHGAGGEMFLLAARRTPDRRLPRRRADRPLRQSQYDRGWLV
jgi:glutaconate CoA-transferase subunit A